MDVNSNNKMKKILVILVLLSACFIPSCVEDPGEPNLSTGDLTDLEKLMLIDKIWFPSSPATGSNFEFIADGTYRVDKKSDGTWSWQNNGDTMKINDPIGAKYNYLFESITASTMSFRTNKNGENYATLIIMKDTE
jgi:hypothetical protein